MAGCATGAYTVTPAPRIAREGGDQRQVVKQEIVPNV